MLYKKKKAKKKSKKKKISKKKKKLAGKKVRARKKKVVRRKPKKAKVLKKKAAKKVPKAAQIEGVQVGIVTHYFPHVKAGAVLIENGTLAVGDVLRIKGHTTDLKQKIGSLQIERVPVQEASAGDEVGILIKSRVRINDKVYKLK
jgi:putative protease